MKLIAYTDGSNTYNGEPYSYGGYGWVLLLMNEQDELIELIKGGGAMPVNESSPVTNNKAEISGLISVCNYIYKHQLYELSSSLQIFTDSMWCVKSISGEWKPKKNLDYLVEFMKVRKALVSKGLTVEVNWVKGHNGDKYNEMADELAGEYAEQVRVDI